MERKFLGIPVVLLVLVLAIVLPVVGVQLYSLSRLEQKPCVVSAVAPGLKFESVVTPTPTASTSAMPTPTQAIFRQPVVSPTVSQ